MYTDRTLLSKNQRNQFPLTVSGESHHVFPTQRLHIGNLDLRLTFLSFLPLAELHGKFVNLAFTAYHLS